MLMTVDECGTTDDDDSRDDDGATAAGDGGGGGSDDPAITGARDDLPDGSSGG